MAMGEDTCAHGALPIRVKSDGEFMLYTGTRAQLLEAGIVGPQTPFPRDPGQRRTFLRLTDDPHRIQWIKPVPRERFTLQVRLDDAALAQYKARQAERHAEWDQRNRERAAAQSAAERLAAAPASFDAYRARFVSHTESLLGVVVQAAGRSDAGYCYAPEVIEQMQAHVQAIEALLATGTITFDPSARDAERARLHAVAARGNGAFDRFMRAAKARP